MVQVDTNLFEDVFRKRQGWQASSAVISLVKKGVVSGCVSAWTAATIYYFRRQSGMTDLLARQRTVEILKGFVILDLTAQVTERALSDRLFSGFEDALQFYTALEHKVDAFVTRNTRHFQVMKGKIILLTPEEFLAQWKEEPCQRN